MSYEVDYKPNLLGFIEDQTIQGWCTPKKAIDLYDRVVTEKPKIVVEIGVFGAKSLLALGLGAKRIGGCKVIGIDPWTYEAALNESEGKNAEWWASLNYDEVYAGARSAIHRALLIEVVQLIRKSSTGALQNVGDDIDILHIDGNHSEWDSCRDVLNWIPKVKKGGIIYMDDEDWATTATAQKFLEAKCDKLDTIESTNKCGVYRKR